ncbi:SAM-dependent methyltransferase [Acrocarpospora catenulata]|uniref:SAM-dependent methyltransferase n=1 Tax=Acrocarpospora catenulata TaxID=2836182 RepID=UPI001BDAB2F4|nr:SAM-dependent methyltransferase [Acrocarpospora catenulata]
MGDLDRVPDGVDPAVPSSARVYDYLLGGKDNYAVDRAIAERLLSVAPDTRSVARANRAFLARAVRFLCEQGITQFIDLGTGIPTSPSVHEVARETHPEARVVYVDNDPLVKVHNDALLATDDRVITLRADIRRPDEIVEHPDVRALIDFDKPVGVLLVTVLHFVSDEEGAYQIVAGLRDKIVSGSYVVLSHSSSDSDPEVLTQLKASTAGSPAQSTFRSHDEILGFFEGLEIESPGLVPVQRWRPTMDSITSRLVVEGAVARKA